jgi:hypothetical protein
LRTSANIKDLQAEELSKYEASPDWGTLQIEELCKYKVYKD